MKLLAFGLCPPSDECMDAAKPNIRRRNAPNPAGSPESFREAVAAGRYADDFETAVADYQAIVSAGAIPGRIGSTITVANKKGGVGKTTTAINIALQLNTLGLRVLLIDLDPDNAATRIILPEEDIRTLAEKQRTVYEWIINNRPFSEVVKPVRPGWDMLPSAKLPHAQPPYNGLKDFLSLERYGKENLLRTRLSKLGQYDVVVVDTPAGNGVDSLHSLAILAADCVCVVCGAEGPDVGSTHYIIQQLEEVESIRFIRLVVTRFKGQAHNEVQLEQLQDEYREYLSEIIIRERSQIGQDNLGLSRASKSIPEYAELSKELVLKLWASKTD